MEKDNYVFVNNDPTKQKPFQPFKKFQPGKKGERHNWTASIAHNPVDTTPKEIKTELWAESRPGQDICGLMDVWAHIVTITKLYWDWIG